MKSAILKTVVVLLCLAQCWPAWAGMQCACSTPAVHENDSAKFNAVALCRCQMMERHRCETSTGRSCCERTSDDASSPCDCGCRVTPSERLVDRIERLSATDDLIFATALIVHVESEAIPADTHWMHVAVDRPPERHNARQAKLCVWLK